MSRAKNPKFKVHFRRRNEGRTNFVKRLALVKSEKPRMVVRRSNSNVVVQFITFDPKGDKTLVTITGKHLLKSFGWPSKRNVWTAYLAGLMAAVSAKKKGVSDFVLDVGLYIPSKGSLLFAALKGAHDAGLKTSFEAEMVPEDKLSNPPEAVKAKFQAAKSKIIAG